MTAHSGENLEALTPAFDDLNAAAEAFPGDIDVIPEEAPAQEEPEQEEIPAVDEDVEGEIAPEAEPEAEEEEAEAEPDFVPIDPPVSWGAEAKETFAALPPDLQAQVVERESQREKFTNEKAQEAAEARKVAQTAEQTQLQLQETLAGQLAQVADRYAPQPPDQALAYSDPMQYNQQLAVYNANKLEHDKFMGQVKAFNGQVSQQYDQAEQAALRADAEAVVNDVPELRDPAAYKALVEGLTPVAKELGYPDDRIANAYPSDVRAMKIASQWKEKHDKYVELQNKSKMTKVRSAKKSAKPNVAQPTGSGKARNIKAATKRLEQTGSLSDAAMALPDF